MSAEKPGPLGTIVWLDGELCTAEQASVSLADRGLTLGDGLFETMLWTGTQIRFLDQHLARMTAAAEALGIEIPFSKEALVAGLHGLSGAALGHTAALRLTLSRGLGPRGLMVPATSQPRMFATIAPYERVDTPITLTTVDIVRAGAAPTSRFKTLSYIDNVMALKQARDKGFDEAVLLNAGGHIACASSANIVLALDDGRVVTPRLEDGALAGIVRGQLLAKGLISEAPVTVADLTTCTAAAITNALLGVRHVASINNRQLAKADASIERLQRCLDIEAF